MDGDTDASNEQPKQNVADKSESKPAAKQNDSKPAAEQNDSKPAAEQNDSKPAAEQNDSKPVAEQKDSKPVAEQNDSKPATDVCAGKSAEAAPEMSNGRPKRRAAESVDKDSDSESLTGLGEGEFFVEKVLDYVYEKGQDMYLIKWKDWGHKYNTWEPQSNLNCLEKIVDFFKHRERASQQKRQRTSGSHPEAREASIRMFEEAHLSPPSDQQLALLFTKFSVNGRLVFKEKLKPLDAVHMEIHDLVRREGVQATTMKALRKIHQLRDQLLQNQLARRREQQLVRLKQWEDELNGQVQEQARLVVENNVDLALPPSDFIYTNDYVPGEGVTIPSDPVIGCECTKCHLGAACCSSKAGAQFAYNKLGKLRLHVGQPIYECNKLCKCGPDCRNRVVQKGRKVKLAIFRTDNGCGWGVKACEPIKRGSFVTEYVGEVITNEEAERRGRQYDAVGNTYLFDLDFNDQINLYTVDAAVYGNVSHFINHSCEPNLVVYGLWADCLDPNLPRLALFACHDIARGQELYFDYNSPLGRNVAAGELPSPEGELTHNQAPLGGNVTSELPSPEAGCGTSAEPAAAAGAASPSAHQDRAAASTPPPTNAHLRHATSSPTKLSPTKSPRRALGAHPSARVTCKCGANSCRRYLF